MTIYEKLCNEAKRGTPFSVSLEDSSLKVGRHWLVQNGKYDGELIDESRFGPDVLKNIEALYSMYKYSYPDKNAKKSRYFKALTADELKDAQMVSGFNREYVRAALEGYVLCMKIKGKIQFADGWFWQSKTDKDLVILKKWL